MPTATKKAVKKSAPKPKARLTKAQRVENFAKLLRLICACPEARAFCQGKTAKEAWGQCLYRGWMEYLLISIRRDTGAQACFRFVDKAPWPNTADSHRAQCKRAAAKFPIEKFAFYKERGL